MTLSTLFRSTGRRLFVLLICITPLFLAQPHSAAGRSASPDVLTVGSQILFREPVDITNSIGVYDTLPSLALDAQGNVHVVYMGTYVQLGAPDNVTTDIFYTHTVDGVFTAPVKIAVPTGFYSKTPTVAVDSNGVAHVVFMRSADQIFSQPEDDIYYANNQTGAFDTVIQLVDGFFGFSDDKPFYCPSDPIILVDGSDRLHVGFLAADTRLHTSFSQLFYTNNSGGVFQDPALVSDGDTYVDNYVIELDTNSLPHFAYQTDTVLYVKALSIQPDPAQFSAPVQAALIPRSVQDFFPGLAVDSQGVAHITFRDPYKPTFSDYELLYTNNAGGAFSAPQNVSLTGFTSSIELDAQDNVHVLYKRLGGKLAYANNLSGSFTYQDLPGYISHTGVNYFKIGPDQRFHVVYYYWYTVNGETEYDIYYVQGVVPQRVFVPAILR